MKVCADRFHIVQVGCGGTGSYVFYYLSRLMFTELSKAKSNRTTVTLVDGDIVEQKNLFRQNFVESDVGMNKAFVLAQRYSAAYGINIEYLDEYVEVIRLGWLLNYTYRNGYIVPILLGCVDNYLARRVLHEVFMKHDVPLVYIDAGNSEATGQVVVGVKGKVWDKYSRNDEIAALPPGSLLPNLLKPDAADESPDLSCADLSLRNGQSIIANFATANLVNMLLNSIINHGSIPYYMASVNVLSGKTKILGC